MASSRRQRLPNEGELYELPVILNHHLPHETSPEEPAASTTHHYTNREVTAPPAPAGPTLWLSSGGRTLHPSPTGLGRCRPPASG